MPKELYNFKMKSNFGQGVAVSDYFTDYEEVVKVVREYLRPKTMEERWMTLDDRGECLSIEIFRMTR